MQLTHNSCLQACIASLLDAPIQKVPNFVEASEVEGSYYPGWWLQLQEYLGKKGLFFLELHLDATCPKCSAKAPQLWFPLPMPALCIFFGTTKAGIKHMIVGRCEGDQMFPVHNPLPGAELDGGIEGLGFLVPRDPQLIIAFGKALDKISRLSGPGSSTVMREISTIALEALGHGIMNGRLIV